MFLLRKISENWSKESPHIFVTKQTDYVFLILKTLNFHEKILLSQPINYQKQKQKDAKSPSLVAHHKKWLRNDATKFFKQTNNNKKFYSPSILHVRNYAKILPPRVSLYFCQFSSLTKKKFAQLYMAALKIKIARQTVW